MKKEKKKAKAEKNAREGLGGNQPRLVTDRRFSNLGCPITTSMKLVN